MSVRVGINGFGSIGRRFFRIAMERSGIEIVAVNDLTDPGTLAHLLKYDSNYGTLPDRVTVDGDRIRVGERDFRVIAERDPEKLPWGELGAEVVIESTGRFTDAEKAAAHLRAGARKVIISAPGKGDLFTVVLGVNEEEYEPEKHHIISNASCTTNGLTPVAKVLDRSFGIVKGLMSTIHSYTNDQVILDFPHHDLRRARAAATNIIPTTTGAARAAYLVLPQLKGRLNGLAFRVPTPTVSVIDLVAQVGRETTVEEVNAALKEASQSYLRGILGYTEEPLVSSDFKGMTESTYVDALSTQVIGDLVKVVSWYDNEWGYSTRLVDLVEYIARRGL